MAKRFSSWLAGIRLTPHVQPASINTSVIPVGRFDPLSHVGKSILASNQLLSPLWLRSRRVSHLLHSFPDPHALLFSSSTLGRFASKPSMFGPERRGQGWPIDLTSPSPRRAFSSERSKFLQNPPRRKSVHSPESSKAQDTTSLNEHSTTSATGPKGPAPGGIQGESESIASSVSKYLHLPKMPHRPTKEELLAAANGFWERVRVRLKWISIRSMRPWNVDEWGAFVSWVMLGHLVWILVGTTTFFSLLIFSINTVFAQGKFCTPPGYVEAGPQPK